MKNSIKSSFFTLAYLTIFPIYTYAAPIIEVDTQNVNVGSIREGKVKRIRHVFKIFNKGDEPLIISKVKAG